METQYNPAGKPKIVRKSFSYRYWSFSDIGPATNRLWEDKEAGTNSHDSTQRENEAEIKYILPAKNFSFQDKQSLMSNDQSNKSIVIA